MTKLLVSVRSAGEAVVAEAAGTDLIDIKEPRRGALGAASPAVVRSIVAQIGDRLPLSVALGDVNQLADPAERLESSSVHFAKVGLAGAPREWRDAWRQILLKFPAHTQPVAVAYADYGLAKAPSPQDILEVGAQLGCAALLIDTFEKNGEGLLDHLDLIQLQQLIETARGQEMMTVLAGSLNVASIREILPLRPAYVAVRGAACCRGRGGDLDGQRVGELVDLVRAADSLEGRPMSTA